MESLCGGCGIPVDGPECLECGTSAKGARFEEAVVVNLAEPRRLPEACCCCLNPAENMSVRSLGWIDTAWAKTGEGFPWCRRCCRRRDLPSKAGALLLVILLGVICFASVELLVVSVGLLACFGAAALSAVVVDRVLPERPGHVARCKAILTPGIHHPNAATMRVVFRNRAFAKIWSELNPEIPGMAVYCTGCGESVKGVCGCGTPAAGASFLEKIFVGIGTSPQAPPVCCRCLRPQERLDRLRCCTRVSVTGDRPIIRSLYIPIPWCRECKARRTRPYVTGFFLSLMLGVIFLFVADNYWKGLGVRGARLILLGACGVMTWIAGRMVHRLLADGPGHVKRCEAARAITLEESGKDAPAGARVEFRNRAFAKKWRDLNG